MAKCSYLGHTALFVSVRLQALQLLEQQAQQQDGHAVKQAHKQLSPLVHSVPHIISMHPEVVADITLSGEQCPFESTVPLQQVMSFFFPHLVRAE